MNKNWINFKELRSKLSLPMVLRMYNVRLEERAGQLVGSCPIPSHDGSRSSSSFSANAGKGIFQCFGCGAQGNLLDFAVLMDNGNPRKGLDVRKTAIKLNKALALFLDEAESSPEGGNSRTKSDANGRVAIVVNQPLEVRLSNLDPEHPYLKGRGFSREILDRFGVGFCSKGSLAGRIVIPLYGTSGELLGYAARVVDDQAITSENPKYLFPGRHFKDGTEFEFRKSLFLYNGCGIKGPVTDLIVVEGFASVWWLVQNGFSEVVGIMGSSFSEEQVHLILENTKPTGRVWIMTDGDKAGEKWARDLCLLLSSDRLVRVLSKERKQPTDFSREELVQMLGV